MARTRATRRGQATKQERLLLLTDPKSPLKNAPQSVKGLFFKNTQLNDIELQDFKNIYKEKQTEVNRCSHKITQNDEEQIAYCCYTCSKKEDTYATICSKCWNAEQHAGHNFEEDYLDDQLCECGKRSQMDHQKFCNKHKEGLIQIEINEQNKKEFVDFFESLWKIFFYLREKNHRRLRDNFREKLMEVLGKLTKNSLYYIRMLEEVFTKTIKPEKEEKEKEQEQEQLEEFTIMEKLFQYEEGLEIIENMLADQKFKYPFFKSLIKYKERTSQSVYFLEHIEDQLINDFQLLVSLSEEGTYAQHRISDYITFAQKEEKGKKLLQKLLEDKCKENESSTRQFLEFIVDNFSDENTRLLENNINKYILEKAFKYLAGDDLKELQGKDGSKEQNDEMDEEKQKQLEIQIEEEKVSSEKGEQQIQQQGKQVQEEEEQQLQEQQQGQQEEEQEEQEEEGSEQEQNQQSEQEEESGQSSGRNDYFMGKVIKYISYKFLNMLGNYINSDKDKISLILMENGVTENDVNLYLKYAFKNIGQLLQNEKQFLIFLVIVNSRGCEEVKNLWTHLFHEKQMLKSLDEIYEIISIIGKIPIIEYQIEKKYIQKSEQKVLDESEVEEWLKSYLFENKQIEQRKLVDMKGEELLSFKNAGNIVKQFCKYNEENQIFTFKSHLSFPNDLLKYSQRRYRNEFQILFGIKANLNSKMIIKNELQKILLSNLFQEPSFFQLYKNKWEKQLQRIEKDENEQEDWKNKRIGYLYIFLMLSAFKLSSEGNKEIQTELIRIRQDKEYRFKFQFLSEGHDLNRILCLDEEVQNPEKPVEAEKPALQQSMKKKREDKKSRLLNKFKKNNENMIENLLTKSKSLCIGDEEDVCLYCHEREREQNSFFYLGHIKKNKTASASLYPETNKIKTLLSTCFHIVHVQCFIKIEKDEHNEFDCPLCSKKMNCLLPIKQNLSDEATEIYQNSLIAVLVSKYQSYTFGGLIFLLFSHLVEAKGLNSLVSLKRYSENKYLKNKIDHYIEEMIVRVYKKSQQKERQKFKNNIEKLQKNLLKVDDELIRSIQLILVKAYSSKIIEGKTEIDLKIFSLLQSKLKEEEFEILRNHLEEIAETLIESEQIMEIEKRSVSMSSIELAPFSNIMTDVFEKDECSKCKKKSKEYLCLLCKETLCSSCRYNEQHSNYHNKNFLIFQANRGRVYNVDDGSWGSNHIYFNDFRQPYDYLSEEQKKKQICELDKEKMNQVLNDFLDN